MKGICPSDDRKKHRGCHTTPRQMNGTENRTKRSLISLSFDSEERSWLYLMARQVIPVWCIKIKFSICVVVMQSRCSNICWEDPCMFHGKLMFCVVRKTTVNHYSNVIQYVCFEIRVY
ncbi:uncharacterized protein LOC143446472 isoform X1 [Clavelina lepadiformis]|uniref:uncharacterized protein LOC143446472 isoform X1 n=1 Tax=Clavelina lepadiformis TaxID=159417 RepID=UPI004042A21B